MEKEVNERMTRRKRERVLSNCGMCRSSRDEKCAIEGLREWDIDRNVPQICTFVRQN